MRFLNIKTWVLGLLSVALVACGGGGSSSGTAMLGGGTTSGIASIQVKFSLTTVDNTGATSNKATVTALDANGKGVAGVPLTIKVDSNATYSVTASTGNTTASDGTVVADVTIGSDTTPRTVTLTASSGSVSAAGTFLVVGSKTVATALTLTGPTTITNSTSSAITISAVAVDANRNALPNIPITFSTDVDGGGVLTPAGSATDSTGTLTATLKIGSDQSNRAITVTARSGSTVTATKVVQVVGAKLTSSGFASTVDIASKANRVVYLLVDGSGNKLANYKIVVTGPTAQKEASPVTSDAGEYVYEYDAPAAAGNITITAVAGGVTIADTIAVGSSPVPNPVVSVKSGSIAVSPNVVAVNSVGATTTNKVEVRALFVGANNAPVKNVRVWFDLAGDKQSIGGVIDSTATGKLLYSDASGVARTTYAPGTRFSPKDGVSIRVCWDAQDFAIPADGGACPHEAVATLTVISDSLSVSVGTNGLLGTGTSGLTYVQRFAVQVVDSAGRAMVGVRVSPSLDLLRYYKGFYIISGSRWVRTGNGNTYPLTYPGSGATVPVAARSAITNGVGSVGICDNEDLNRNGVAESFKDTYESQANGGADILVSEDQNASGNANPVRQILEPRKADVTMSIEGADTTDSNGIVVLKIEYPQNLATWVKYSLLVAASGVAGTEGRASYQADLLALASVITNLEADPPFKNSPYGFAQTATFLRQNPEGQSGWLCTNPD